MVEALKDIMDKYAVKKLTVSSKLVVYVAAGRDYRMHEENEMFAFATRRGYTAVPALTTMLDGSIVTKKTIIEAGFETHRIYGTNNAINCNIVEKGVHGTR